MALTVLTDHAEISAVVGRAVAADPVRSTVLGTIGRTLTDSAWAAVGAGGLAVRSASAYPVTATNPIAAATRSILDEGAVPVLFTDLANPTSNKSYQLLGYRPVEDRVVLEFS